jgi:dTDP-4-amino-4,6-dideoxygalactose transaminase
VADALTQGPVALVVCVDTFGNPCDYQALCAVCTEAQVPLIADSAAALGSRHAGQPVGTQADAHAYSMSFAKVLSAAGAGGAVVLRTSAVKHNHDIWLRSALMDEIHAVAALDQLAVLAELVERRNRIAAIYAGALGHFDPISTQHVTPENRHSYVHWVMRVPQRPLLARRLARLGVETREYFRALHLDGQALARPLRLPVTQALDAEVLALPMSSELTDEDAETVVAALEIALAQSCTR